MRKKNLLLLLSLMLIVTIACSTETEITAVETIKYNTVETIISFEDEKMGTPGSIKYAGDGLFYLMDYSLEKIFALDQDGNILNTFGRQGDGPGEFGVAMMTSLFADENNVYLSDAVNARINKYSRDGEFRDAIIFESRSFMGSGLNISGDVLLVAADSNDEGLIRLSSIDNQKDAIILGANLGANPDFFDFGEMRTQISRGEIPIMLARSVLTSIDDEGNIYLIYQAYTRVQKYSPVGELIWDQQISYPEKQGIFDAFVENNTNAPDGRLYNLSYFSGGEVHGGQLYLYVRVEKEDKGFVLVLDEDGNLKKRIEFPDMEFAPYEFTYRPETDRFYFTNMPEGEVYYITQ